MTRTLTEPLQSFRKVFDGELITSAEQATYDTVRALWNTEIDRRPAVIARCVNRSDVAAAVNFAREQDLEIAVRCGSHNAAGTAACDDGLMIDLSLMRSVTVDPAARRVRVAGGALLGDMDAATQEHGLATTAGTVSHTGVGGLTLGGGFGWLGHRHGLAVDNLVSAEVVTADGQILRASEQENPDLFWALRGGGGNFGVVTEFEFRLHDVGPMIDFGMLFYPLEQGGQALRVGREVVAAASRDVTVFMVALNAPPEEFVPAEHRFKPGFAVLLAGFGSDDEHVRALPARPQCRAPALRTGRSNPLRRVAADARRGERLGPVLLREGLQSRGTHRRGDRGHRRAGPAQELAADLRRVHTVRRRL